MNGRLLQEVKSALNDMLKERKLTRKVEPSQILQGHQIGKLMQLFQPFKKMLKANGIKLLQRRGFLLQSSDYLRTLAVVNNLTMQEWNKSENGSA